MKKTIMKVLLVSSFLITPVQIQISNVGILNKRLALTEYFECQFFEGVEPVIEKELYYDDLELERIILTQA